jgi:hydrogenase expression/formation protein HypE
LASATNEIATASRVGVVLDRAAIRVPSDVEAGCEMLGLDPLYVANEGIMAAFIAPELAEAALSLLQSEPLGRDAFLAGWAVIDHPGLVVLKTELGTTRIVDLLPGDQLPRIC